MRTAAKQRAISICGLILLLSRLVKAEAPSAASIFPMGASRGNAVEVSVHGKDLSGATGVVFDCPAIEGKILNATATEVKLTVRLAAEADEGFHSLLVITPQGMSSPVAFRVNAVPTINGETQQPFEFPVAVGGRLSQLGEVDRYMIQGRRGQRLGIEVVTGSGVFETNTGAFVNPSVRVYRPEGSWTAHQNPNRGRDHWPECWSILLGGGGIRGGVAVGASDERGATVADRMVSIGEVFATVYKAMGIDWTVEYMHPVGRPLKIANGLQDVTGVPIQELI